MCNCKGWDIAYYPEFTTVQPHFCRIMGDCFHSDNTLEEAAAQVAEWYRLEIEDYHKVKQTHLDYDSPKYLKEIEAEYHDWKNLTHETYLYYKTDVDKPEDGDTL